MKLGEGALRKPTGSIQVKRSNGEKNSMRTGGKEIKINETRILLQGKEFYVSVTCLILFLGHTDPDSPR